jgi:hypothetical protein
MWARQCSPAQSRPRCFLSTKPFVDFLFYNLGDTEKKEKIKKRKSNIILER